MDSNMSDLDSIRKGAVSRRGGVRVRGGRLPPIRIGNVTISSANKKVFTPNIPQRRIKVKQEILDPVEPCSSHESKEIENSRGRGRGRGSKVFLQTNGSFLGEGPALRIRREQQTSFYDRSSYVSSSRSKTVEQVKIDSSKIDELLENYDDKEALMDSDWKPVRLPFPKLEKSRDLKPDIQKYIKSEDVKPFIKQEPIDDEWNNFVSKYSIDIKKEEEDDTKVFDFLKNFKLFKDENILVLLQFPSCLPFGKEYDLLKKEKSLSEENKNPEKEVTTEEEVGVSVRDLAEGYLGKLQVMKSGRMRVIMGSIILALEDGVDSQSIWEAASIPIENKNEGDVIILGRIGFKMVLRPDLKYVMESPSLKKNCL